MNCLHNTPIAIRTTRGCWSGRNEREKRKEHVLKFILNRPFLLLFFSGTDRAKMALPSGWSCFVPKTDSHCQRILGQSDICH